MNVNRTPVSTLPARSARPVTRQARGELSINEKLRLYNLHVTARQPDPDALSSRETLPLEAPPRALPPQSARSPSRRCCTSMERLSPTSARRQAKTTPENIDDADDSGHLVPINPPSSKLRMYSAQGTARLVPTMRYHSILDVKRRARSVCACRAAVGHNLPLSSPGAKTMRGLALRTMAKRRVLRASHSANGRELMLMELPTRREGYLWKQSRHSPEKWQPRYCILRPQTFIFLARRDSSRLKGCVQFDLASADIDTKLRRTDSAAYFQYRL